MSFEGELKGISKSYGSNYANREVNLLVRAGTIHALVGENGAGKSTAMKILFGSVVPDCGEIRFANSVVNRLKSKWCPERAFKQGIGMVHQHFMLAGPESVHDNLVLGAESTRFGVRNRRQEKMQLEALMKSSGLQVPLDLPVDELPIGLQSRCEILKVLYRKARFLILDEPTAVLTPQEISDFLSTLKKLRDQGHTILIVTHKLKEVMTVADEATILRAGQTVATRKIAETNVDELSELMVGRRLHMPRARHLESRHANSVRARLTFANSSVELRAHEITGIAGVEGSGQERLVKAFVDPVSIKEWSSNKFDVQIFGQNARKFSFQDTRKLPVALIPADRHREGLILNFSLTENLRLGRKQIEAKGLFGPARDQEKKLLSDFDVRPSNPDLPASALSGGNQQKVIVARELGDLGDESIVIAVHPTRGVDLGAIEFIHGKLLEAAAKGAAILLVSSELDELMALSHRLAVMYQGTIAEWFDGPQYDEKLIGLAMLTGSASGGIHRNGKVDS